MYKIFLSSLLSEPSNGVDRSPWGRAQETPPARIGDPSFLSRAAARRTRTGETFETETERKRASISRDSQIDWRSRTAMLYSVETLIVLLSLEWIRHSERTSNVVRLTWNFLLCAALASRSNAYRIAIVLFLFLPAFPTRDGYFSNFNSYTQKNESLAHVYFYSWTQSDCSWGFFS